MLSKFKLGAISLAVLIAFVPAANAATSKHSKHAVATTTASISDSANSTTNAMTSSYPMTFAGTVPTTKAWQWSPNAPVMPTNYDQFMVWAEDINAGKSNEPLFSCWNDMVCVSGLLDLDLLAYDRAGTVFGPTATSTGVGVRPHFGPNEFGVMGSINNANLFFDLKFAGMVRIHGNIDYVNAGVKTDSYAWHNNSDLSTAYTSAASIKADELYAVFSTPNTYPLYAKIGRFYLDFGQYQPNGYGLPTITPSLTQLMTQTRTGGAQIGFGMQNGLYGSGTWSMAQQSLLALNRRTSNRNYSARLGMMRQYEDSYFNVNASYVWDIRDADYFNGGLFVGSNLVPAVSPFYNPYSMRRQHAYAIHGDGKYGQFGGGVEAAATTGALNPDRNSNLWTAGANVNYSFPTLAHDSSLDLSYQVARHTAVIYGSAVIATFPFTGATIGPFSNQMPKNRIQISYLVKIVNHVNLGLQLVRDKDFAQPSGTNLTSHFGIIRLDMEV